MKFVKIVALALASSLLLSFAACSGSGKKDESAYTVPSKTYAWPKDALFGDVPALSDKLNTYVKRNDKKGTTVEFGVVGMDYSKFREYVLSLEKAGFEIYDVAGLGTASTADSLPEKLEKDATTASWIGSRRGLYVAAQWYADEFYSENKLPQGNNVKLTFYTYNPYK